MVDGDGAADGDGVDEVEQAAPQHAGVLTGADDEVGVVEHGLDQQQCRDRRREGQQVEDAAIPALLLIQPVLNNTDYIIGAGQDTRVLWGCLLDFVNAVTAVGSAVAVYPVVKRYGESLALGFVTSRLMEAAVIITGIVSLLAVVGLRQDFAGAAGADASALTTTGQALVTVRDWTFLFGPGFMVSANAVLFGTLLYRSGLVPRIIPTLGLIGAPLLLTANLLTFFGHNTQTSGWSMLATVPIFVWGGRWAST